MFESIRYAIEDAAFAVGEAFRDRRTLGTMGLVLLLCIGLGVVGYELGSGGLVSEAEAQRASDQAFAQAATEAERQANPGSKRSGYAQGLADGLKAGRIAGIKAGKLALQQARQQARQQTQANSLPTAIVWAVGDGADGGRAGKSVAQMIASGNPDRFLYLGDVYEAGTASDFNNHYDPTYGILASVTEPTPGNHDWPNHSQGYDPYWRAAKGQAPAAWYSFEVGGWQFLSLNSEAPHSSGSAQINWLRQTIASSPGFGTCRIAFWHRPRYSGGTHGPNGDVQPFWDALGGHASVVLNGHDHDMQRFAPVGGITELVAGSGGHGHYPVHSTSGLQFSNDNAYGAVRLTLQQNGVQYAFFSTSGSSLDSGQVGCQPG